MPKKSQKVKTKKTPAKRKHAKPKPKGEEDRKIDWRINHTRIFSAFVKLLGMAGIRPTNEEIGAEVSLSRACVEGHIKSIDFSVLCEDARIHLPQVVEGLASRARKNYKDCELYLALVAKWEKKNLHVLKGHIEHTTEDTTDGYTDEELEEMERIHDRAEARRSEQDENEAD